MLWLLPVILPVSSLFLLIVFSYLIYHYYSRRIGIDKIRKFIHFKEKEIAENIHAKTLDLDDARSVLSIELRRFNQLRADIEKKLYSLDDKLNQVEKHSKQFKKNLKGFQDFEEGMKSTISQAEKQLQFIEAKENVSQKIEQEVNKSMSKLDSFKEIIQQSFQKIQADLSLIRDQSSAEIKNKVNALEKQIEQKKQDLHDDFSEKVDEIRDLNEQLKSGMQEKQEEIFEQNETKLISFFNEQIRLGKEEIDLLRKSFKENEVQFQQNLTEIEERQLRISEKQSLFYSEFDTHKEKVTQKISDASDAILEAFKIKIQEYERSLTQELDVKYDGFTDKVNRIEDQLKIKEEETIQEADEQFQNIQKSILDYQTLLSTQIKEITDQYQHIKETLITQSQKELQDIGAGMQTLQADMNQAETINQMKTEKLNRLMKYIEEAENTINGKVKNFETYYTSVQSKLKELEGEKLSLVLHKGVKLKKRIDSIVHKEIAAASALIYKEQKEVKKEATIYLNQLKETLSEQGHKWQNTFVEKQQKDIIEHLRKTTQLYFSDEKQNHQKLLQELSGTVKNITKHSEEEIASLQDKYNEMNVLAESIEEELSLMQAKRSDFQHLEGNIKSLYNQQEQAIEQIESSLKEKALQQLELLEGSNQDHLKEL